MAGIRFARLGQGCGRIGGASGRAGTREASLASHPWLEPAPLVGRSTIAGCSGSSISRVNAEGVRLRSPMFSGPKEARGRNLPLRDHRLGDEQFEHSLVDFALRGASLLEVRSICGTSGSPRYAETLRLAEPPGDQVERFRQTVPGATHSGSQDMCWEVGARQDGCNREGVRDNWRFETANARIWLYLLCPLIQ